MSRKLPPEFERDVSLDYTEDELSNIKRRLIVGGKAMSMMDFRLSIGILFQSPRFIEPALYAVPFTFLKADKVPLVKNRINKTTKSVDHSERAYLSILALSAANRFAGEIGKNREVTDIMYKGWPGAFSWMQFFFGAVIQREQEIGQNTKYSADIVDILCQALTTFLSVPRLEKLVVFTPGLSTLATHLWTRGDDSELSGLKGRHLGSSVMNTVLNEGKSDKRILDEMVAVMGGKPSNVAVTALSRLRTILDGANFTVRRLWAPLMLCGGLMSGEYNPVRDALLGLPFIRIVGKLLSRLLDITFVQDDPTYLTAQQLITLCFIHFKQAMQHANGIPWVLQCLEAGILESYVNCCPTLFAFDQFCAMEIIATFQVISCNLVHLPVAQMAIALHKKLTKEMPVHRLINKAIPSARNAWIRFQCMVMEREEIISKLPPSSSMPVKCDFCTKLFERKLLKKCAGCASALYCSKSCQSRAWKEKDHRTQCKNTKTASPGGKDFGWSAQEKLFMMRVAINYAQAKKDLLWRMVKCDLEGIRLDVSHHILPVLAFVGINDPDHGANHEAGRIRDDTIGIRKVRVSRDEEGSSARRDIGLVADLPTDLQNLPLDGEDGRDDTREARSSAREDNCDSKDCEGEYIEKLEFYEPSEEPHVLLERKRTTPIHMGITVPLGGRDHNEEFIVTEFWSYEGFFFSETKESELEYKREAGDPDVDKYFARRRGGIPHKDIEAREEEIRRWDGAENGKEKSMKLMLNLTEGMERTLFTTKVHKAEDILRKRGSVKLGIIKLSEVEKAKVV